MVWVETAKVNKTSSQDKGFGFYSKSYGKTPKQWADMRQNLHFNEMTYCCCIEHDLVRGKYGRGEISWTSNSPLMRWQCTTLKWGQKRCRKTNWLICILEIWQDLLYGCGAWGNGKIKDDPYISHSSSWVIGGAIY